MFVDANAAPNVLAHELGHILGGKHDEAKHVKGADGKEESGDAKNLMFGKPEGGKELTPEQAQAFKTSIYGQISKAAVKEPEEKEEVEELDDQRPVEVDEPTVVPLLCPGRPRQRDPSEDERDGAHDGADSVASALMHAGISS